MLLAIMVLLSIYGNQIEIDNNVTAYTNESMTESVPLVKGAIIFNEYAKSFSGATIYVCLEDVSLQDAPSKLISQQIIRDVFYDSTNREKIEFAIYGDIPDVRARHSINVHVDVDNNGRISEGDFITMQSYPVLTYSYPDNLSVNVKEVK
jgi:uncharacterized lipoprotein YbaY